MAERAQNCRSKKKEAIAETASKPQQIRPEEKQHARKEDLDRTRGSKNALRGLLEAVERC